MSQIVGPSAGGLLIQVVTAPYAVLLDAASFIWSASWVAAITPGRRGGAPPDRNLRREIGEGLRFVLGNRLLRSIALCTGSSNLFASMAAWVFYVLLARELSLSPGWLGLIGRRRRSAGWRARCSPDGSPNGSGQGPAIWISALAMGPFGFVAPFVQRDWTLALLAVAQGVMWLPW